MLASLVFRKLLFNLFINSSHAKHMLDEVIRRGQNRAFQQQQNGGYQPQQQNYNGGGGYHNNGGGYSNRRY